MKRIANIAALVLLVYAAMLHYGVPLPFVAPPPIDDAGMHVLAVEQSEDRGQYTPDQVATLAWLPIYLAKHDCEWAVMDADAPLENATHWVAKAMKRERNGMPWLIVSRGEGGNYEGPLPDRSTIQRLVEGSE